MISSQLKVSGWKLLIATFTQAKNPYQILIIPLTMFTGFSLAFISAEFTAVSSFESNMSI